MIKLNAGFSRKVGEPNYGSRGASVNVELELESGLIGDPDALMTKIQNLFDIARRSVDAELNGGRTPDRSTNGRDGNGRRNDRPATASQIRAIKAICERQNRDADRVAHDRFGVRTVDELSLKEASSVIDELKAATGERAGGGR